MEETRQKILQTAYNHFTKHGIRSVSMDDIAREMGMSKKTLYQYVVNKADLIKQTMQLRFEAEHAVCEQIFGGNRSAIDEMLDIAEYISQEISRLNPTSAHELRKYYPECWELMEQHRQHFVAQTVLRNLQKGMEQGVYRADIKPDLVVHMYLSLIQSLFVEQLMLTQYPLVVVYLAMISYHIHAIATPTGLAYFNQHIEKIKHEKYGKYF